ncbi:aminotransferase class V-fold PLP-dependent enzyme [Reinekea blandensis]|uniref:Uncharacterized protein n=1 Tax=Reinekea blandensis MED297 TaxID=314283 RepID=A4BDG2_9GAMM|nr:aminotransferase class V-fold PLP-dependent enzyme [Reinekea blandensis]EAR09906.1 hypothetical protein MED297_06139 [Reinekea sp. MED297] [Reinekea blandensis MED297]
MTRLNWTERAAELAGHYQRFRVSERILLTGHSHQAWPDCAREAQLNAFDDAAEWVDDKWSRAFEQADRVREEYRCRLGDSSGELVLGPNTQELLVRWLSALPLTEKPRLVTTDGEFHSMRRLLDRLDETAIEVHKVPAEPVATLASRLSDAVDDRTAAVLCSMVMFQSGAIVPHLDQLGADLRRKEVPLLIDAYHAVNIVPVSLDDLNLGDAFVVGGGYKYCQLGEGNCFLRVPRDCNWRPIVTGWFAEFATLDQAPDGSVQYGSGRWAFEGSTYDATSHYRAARVFEFFNEQQLDAATLRAINLAQLRCLLDALKTYDWPDDIQLPDDNLESRGGFLVIRTSRASELVRRLREHDVYADARADSLRLGPAPYVTETQLLKAAEVLHSVV